MKELVIFNLILIAIITVGLWCVKRFARSERSANIILLCAAIFTILCHYSSLVYHHFSDGTAMQFLRSNPNLVLPIYPCNVVMWSCLIFALCRNKQSRFAALLADYIFWFGIFSALVGMFANVDFIKNPTLADYDITKGIVAHATLLFNVLLMPLLGHIKIDFKKNLLHMLVSVIGMFLIGLYCNLVFEVLVSEAAAYHINSMFILHSPFDGLDFLTYPTIAGIALILYVILFAVCDFLAYERGNRFYNRLFDELKERRDARRP